MLITKHISHKIFEPSIISILDIDSYPLAIQFVNKDNTHIYGTTIVLNRIPQRKGEAAKQS